MESGALKLKGKGEEDKQATTAQNKDRQLKEL